MRLGLARITRAVVQPAGVLELSLRIEHVEVRRSQRPVRAGNVLALIAQIREVKALFPGAGHHVFQ